MPFGDWFDEYFEEIFVPAISACGLDPKRADDLYRPSAIVNDIWDYTKMAKIVVADLTGKNANVFYELGLAHATGKPAILIAQSMNDVPFDLRALRVIEYDKNSPVWGDTLKKQLSQAIVETLAAPRSTVLPTFLNRDNFDISKVPQKKEDEIVILRQEIEMLKRQMRSIPMDDIRKSRVDIGANKAKELIKDFLKRGLSTNSIIEALEPLGPPRHWLQKAIGAMQAEIDMDRGSDGPKDILPENKLTISDVL